MAYQFIYENERMYYKNEEGIEIMQAKIPMLREGVIEIRSVVVDPSLRGQGLGAKLMEAFYDYVKENNLKVVPVCTFAIKWFDTYKERQDVLL